jgi:hypothetical protein
MIQPYWKDIIQVLGENEISIIEKEAPECQKYKLESETQK